MPRLINATIPDSHIRLLKKAMARVKMQKASVSTFERFGLSGAVLYRLTPPRAIPYVVKVDKASKIDREHDDAVSVQDKFDDLHVVKPVGPEDEKKALMYRLIAAERGVGGVVELKHKYELALQTTAEPGRLKEVVTAIERTYAKFLFAHEFTHNGGEAKFGDQYGRYVRLKDRSTDRLTHLFEGSKAPLYAYGTKFTNPQKVVERILDQRLRPLWVSATHGDLHPSNVVFSSSHDPRVIDFAHAACDQHLLKDFVTMESSLRFMMFPRHIHPDLMGPVDTALNTHWSCTTAQEIIRQAMPSAGASALAAMIACVQVVRKSCNDVLERGGRTLPENEIKEEYFRCLALLLLGQQQFDTFPLIRVAVNLHMLGELYA